MGKSRGIQLDLSKRMVISNCLKEEMSLIQIAKLLNYHSSTISREIRKYRTLEFQEEKKLSLCSRCLNNAICRLHHRCGDILCNQMCCGCKILKVCDKQKLFTCNIERKFPFVCDGCARKRNCKLNHYRYDAKEADKNSTILRHDSRIGLNMDKNEYLRMNEALKIGHDKGQSIYHIVHASEDVNRCTKSIYNYINRNQVSVKRIDLPRAVMLKKRKQLPKKYEYNENKNIDRSNRTYADWLVYQAKNRIILYWQMDFLGAPHNSDQQILTLTLPQFKFALFVPLENPNNQSVKFVFDELERMLGNDFSRVFEVILTDRDSKFNCFKEIEVNALGEIRSHVFFCNPGASNEKPNIENFNSQIRATFNKGIHLSNITWKQCNIISSNYNSRFLNSIDGKRPIDLFIECFGEEIIKKLDLKIIEPNEVKILNFKKY